MHARWAWTRQYCAGCLTALVIAGCNPLGHEECSVPPVEVQEGDMQAVFRAPGSSGIVGTASQFHDVEVAEGGLVMRYSGKCQADEEGRCYVAFRELSLKLTDFEIDYVDKNGDEGHSHFDDVTLHLPPLEKLRVSGVEYGVENGTEFPVCASVNGVGRRATATLLEEGRLVVDPYEARASVDLAFSVTLSDPDSGYRWPLLSRVSAVSSGSFMPGE